MKFNYKIKAVAAMIIGVAAITGCQPDSFESELGPLPEPAFSAVPLASNPNSVVFTNTSVNGFLQQWDFGNGTTSTKAKDTIHFVFAGEYNIKLTVFGKGGHKSLIQKITIENDDPCSNPALDKLAGPCDSEGKTWVLRPSAGALTVGAPDGAVWWSNDGAYVVDPDVTCLFNDTWTFTRDGAMIFDNHGDQRVDEEGGGAWPGDIGLAVGCHDPSAIPAQYQTWGSGNHQFELTPTNLKVKGTGAYMGMYKVGEHGTTPTPESEINYQIIELSASKLVLQKTFDWGYWRFEFVPQSDEAEGADLIDGGDMEDESKWNIFGAGIALTTTEFADGALKLNNGTGTAQTNVIIWQAVDVQAGKYRFSADVKGSGAANSWLEVYFGSSAPVDGSDYSENLYTGLNTWDGCGASAFDGNLSVLGCKLIEGAPAPGNGKNGEITFDSAGTIYVVFKVGSWDGSLGEQGITIDNIRLVEIQ